MSLHHYPGALVANVWLKNGFRRHQTQWGEGTSYSDIEGLARAIALELCLSAARLDQDGVRFLRKQLDMTQAQLAEELGCTNQAIAKWEKGQVALPTAPARLLRLLVLRRIAPNLPLSAAVPPYAEPTPERLVFSYSANNGWRCAERVAGSAVEGNGEKEKCATRNVKGTGGAAEGVGRKR